MILDDLDRIDPHHIFRIINSFAAQYDYRNEGSENKFGFDKIILVCDLNNIRRIFEARYGQDVDFSGYIDKFYDREVFSFDNRKALKSVIKKSITAVSFYGDNESHNDFLNNANGFIKNQLAFIFSELIRYGRVNLRTLLKYRNEGLPLPSREVFLDPNWPKSSWQFSLILMLESLLKHFGEEEKLLTAISFLEGNNIDYNSIREYNALLGEAILIVDYDNHKFNFTNPENSFTYHDVESKTYVTYRIHMDIIRSSKVYTARSYQYRDTNLNEEKKEGLPNLFSLWLKAYSVLKGINYF